MEASDSIKQKLKNYCGNNNTVILCIGSDRITGDCLGPIVGELLTGYYNIPAFVYGTLKKPVTAINLMAVISMIRAKHNGCKIIAVDSCIGEDIEVGMIRTVYGGLYPGSADGKNLPKIGHVSITAVTCDQLPSSPAFASVRLGFVYKLSHSIAKGIKMFFDEREYKANISTVSKDPYTGIL